MASKLQSESEIKQLLDLYATTVFLCSEPIPYSSFAIITANNPLGEILTVEQNKTLNDKLKAQLSIFEYQEVIGASPDLVHQEISFAVQVDLSTAITLAKEFKQNAIFWIESGKLSIEPALLQFSPVRIGKFKILI